MQAHLILPDDAAEYWPRVEAHLEKAILSAPGDMTVDWAKGAVERGEIGLLVITDGRTVDAAALLRIDTWRDGKRVNVLALGGKGIRVWGKTWKAAVLKIAKAENCVGVVAYGRKGFDRVFGAEALCTVYEMRL